MDFEPVMESQNGAAIALLIRYTGYGTVGDRIKRIGMQGKTPLDGFEL